MCGITTVKIPPACWPQFTAFAPRVDWQPWINYHRFARSLWCPEYDPEFGALNWFPSEPGVLGWHWLFLAPGRRHLLQAEMKEAIEIMRASVIDEVTGSVFWWPHGVEYKRSLTRCSRGQGAWAWQYVGTMVPACRVEPDYPHTHCRSSAAC